jgi:hypothetical protein
MSFDVNIVIIDINKYKDKNNLICEFLNLDIKRDARYEKNPDSSNVIDIIDIDMNNTNIFKGFIEVFDVN